MAKPVIYVAITTYNRPEMLADLLSRLRRSSRGVSLTIHVYDDASDLGGYIDDIARRVWYTRMDENHGRDYYWALVNKIFADAREREWDYFLMLPDDVTLKKGFFKKALTIMRKAESNKNLACVSFNTDARVMAPNWTGFNPVRQGSLILTQWTDLCFMAKRAMLDALDWEVKPCPGYKSESSGVGAQVSRRLCLESMAMYHSATPLVHHGDHPSVMHPVHRRENPLSH